MWTTKRHHLPAAIIILVAAVGTIVLVTMARGSCAPGLRRAFAPDAAAAAAAASVWKDNAFSSATSGKLFHMRVVRPYGGNRLFSPANEESSESKQSDGQTHAIPRLTSLGCKMWAVITTISSPTTTVLQLDNLAKQGELCLVVVGDNKTPPSYRLGNNSIYLSPEDQEQLPYAVIKHLPWNHFGRKNVGFLYAIHHGADLIYDTDDDNELFEDLRRIPIPGLNEYGVFQTRHHVLNPYPCFSSEEESETHAFAFSWPRGFPLAQIKNPSTIPCRLRDATEREYASVGVIQSLANHDPDVDAIYRLTRPLPVRFGSSSEAKHAAIVPRGTLIPYNAQATLYTRRAAWGLLLPITVHGRVSDIWRSYFTQSVMWRAGLSLAMSRPWVTQRRNAHNYLGDLQAEQNLYYQADALVDYLARDNEERGEEIERDEDEEKKVQAARTHAGSVPASMEDLYVRMYERGVIELGDLELARSWLSDLRAVGYVFPQLETSGRPRGVASGSREDMASSDPNARTNFSVFRKPES